MTHQRVWISATFGSLVASLPTQNSKVSSFFPWPKSFQVKNPETPPSVSRNKPFLSVLPGPLKSLHPKVYSKTPLFHFEISSTFSTTHALSQTPWLNCTDPCPQLGALSPFLRAQGFYIPSGLIGRLL